MEIRHPISLSKVKSENALFRCSLRANWEKKLLKADLEDRLGLAEASRR